MITYLLHVSLLIGLLFGFYRLLLSGETFFGLHRWVLLGGIALAFALPLISIPSQYSLKEVIITETSTEAVMTSADVIFNTPAIVDVDAIANEPSASLIARPEKTKVSTLETTVINNEIIPFEESESSSWLAFLSAISIGQIVMSVYALGIICLFLYLCFQLLLLAKFRRRGQITSSGRYTIVEHDDCDQSFSFGRVIYLHKSADQVLDRDHIIRHEMIHARQLHSVDIIIGELLTIVLWFNPFAWMYKKAMRDNLEYLTDRQMLDEGADTKAYQLSLVRITVPHTLSQMRQPSAAVALANNYNHSTLKQRIIMMNKKYSSYANAWRHLMILPVMGITMAICNNVIAEQATPEQTMSAVEAIDEDVIIQQDIAVKEITSIKAKTTPVQLINESQLELLLDPKIKIEELGFILDHGVAMTTPDININPDRIANFVANTVSSVVPDVVFNVVPNVLVAGLDEAFNSEEFLSAREEHFKDVLMSTDGEVTGRWEIEDDCLHLWMRGKNYYSNWTACDFDLSGFTQSTIAISRDAGTLTLTESAGNEIREGRFSFEASADFQSFLTGKGITGIRDREMLHMFNTDINEEYINLLAKKGFKTRKSDVIALAVHSIDDADLTDKINALESRNFETNDLEDIIAMGIHNVDGEYMDEIDALGYQHRKMQDYISMRIHDVDKELVTSLKSAGYDNLSADDIVSMAIHDVDEEFINGLADAGYRNLDVSKIVSMAIHDVNPRFIKNAKAMGFEDLELDDLIGFAIHDVDQDYIEALQEAGVKDLDADDITSFAIHDVDPKLIRFLKEGDWGNISNKDILSAAIHDIDEDFLRELGEVGMTDLDFDDIVSFSIHDVDSDYINALRELGMNNLSPKDLISGKIHNVRPSFIEEISNLGFENLDMDDLIDLRIHDIDANDIERIKEKEGEKRDLKDYSRKIRRRNR